MSAAPRLAPSSLNWTLVDAELSLAVAATVTALPGHGGAVAWCGHRDHRRRRVGRVERLDLDDEQVVAIAGRRRVVDRRRWCRRRRSGSACAAPSRCRRPAGGTGVRGPDSRRRSAPWRCRNRCRRRTPTSCSASWSAWRSARRPSELADRGRADRARAVRAGRVDVRELATVIIESTACDSVAVTTAPLSGDGAKARQISAVPA